MLSLLTLFLLLLRAEKRRDNELGDSGFWEVQGRRRDHEEGRSCEGSSSTSSEGEGEQLQHRRASREEEDR